MEEDAGKEISEEKGREEDGRAAGETAEGEETRGQRRLQREAKLRGGAEAERKRDREAKAEGRGEMGMHPPSSGGRTGSSGNEARPGPGARTTGHWAGR